MNDGNWHRRSIERTNDRQTDRQPQPAKFNHLPLRAMTLEAGFMMAESAEIGLLMGLVGSDRSMMTTWFVSPTFSRTQMNLSDSMVRLLKPTLAALIPTLVSWKEKERTYVKQNSVSVYPKRGRGGVAAFPSTSNKIRGLRPLGASSHYVSAVSTAVSAHQGRKRAKWGGFKLQPTCSPLNWHQKVLAYDPRWKKKLTRLKKKGRKGSSSLFRCVLALGCSTYVRLHLCLIQDVWHQPHNCN